MTEKKNEADGDINGVFCHPERLRILLRLREDPTYVSELSRVLNIDRGIVGYHIGILEAHGYLNGKHEISETGNSKGRAIHMFSVTEKAEKRLSMLSDILSGA